jgi:DNA polymerase I-like protein with 3'-5' exonuclease and polymerase domains
VIALDTETTGLSFHHGCQPFLVTCCAPDGSQSHWEWDVDPETRKVNYLLSDLAEIRCRIKREVAKGEPVILHNAKFDVTALGVTPGWEMEWPWESTHDTLIASHLLASNQPHDLTSLTLHYLGADIKPLEDALHQACVEARRIARSKFPSWRIAKEGLEELPSASAGNKDESKPWKSDYWLPRAVARALEYDEDHPWWVVLSTYANADSSSTVALWQVMERRLKKLDLWDIYQERMRVLPVAWKMEQRAATYSVQRSQEIQTEYEEESQSCERICTNIALDKGHELKLGAGGANTKSLNTFCFDVLRLPIVKRTEKGSPSLDKHAMEEYSVILDKRSVEGAFLATLQKKRKLDKTITSLQTYDRYALPLERITKVNDDGKILVQRMKGWARLHPNMNPTGTATLRWSINNPNTAQCGKDEVYGVRGCFGPAPGREWWSLDYENIELRIPAYESGERKMIELFERPDEPPYFGSYHLLNAGIIYPDLFTGKVCPKCLGGGCEQEIRGKKRRVRCLPPKPLCEIKGGFKKKYAATWYQFDKNFGFAFQYAGGEATCDRAAHKKGAWRAVKDNLTELTKLNDKYVRFANKHGYVETLPDRTLGHKRGYPMWCHRNEWSKVKPTQPLNYHVQGSACHAANRAMVRCDEYLEEVTRKTRELHFITLLVHDELVFDFPQKDNMGNLPKVKELQRLMQLSGTDINIPLRVAITYNPVTWKEGIAV